MSSATSGRGPDGPLATSVPAEVVVSIFGNCTATSDALALSRTCHRLRGIFRAHAAAALWPVWRREIPLIEDALLVVRMTDIVLNAERRREPPPLEMPPIQPGYHPPHPTLRELRATMGTQRLSRLLISRFCSLGGLWYPGDRNNEQGPESPERMFEWETGFRKSIFRYFVVSAALAGLYQQPVWAALASPDPDISNLDPRRSLSRKQIAFLEQFVVSSMASSPEAEESVFGPVGQWLLNSILTDKTASEAMGKRFQERYGRGITCPSVREDTEDPCPLSLAEIPSHSNAHLVVWDLFKILWVCEQSRGNLHCERALSRSASHPDSSPRLKLDADIQDWARIEAATVVFFDVFAVEEISLPYHIRQSHCEELVVRPAGIPPSVQNDTCGSTGKTVQHQSVVAFLDGIFRDSGHPNHYDLGDGELYPMPPLENKFFVYFLRRYLGVRFRDDAFDDDEYRQGYTKYWEHIKLFSLDDVDGREGKYDTTGWGEGYFDYMDGTELLVPYEPTPETCYEPV